MNVILVGDMAQIPPVNGTPLYSYNFGKSASAELCKKGKQIMHDFILNGSYFELT